jgi:3,4-dihydroxy 2-butanone 4-phosphate synthase/GTP cyclohydrolase II
MIKPISVAQLATIYGNFNIHVFKDDKQVEVVVLAKAPFSERPLVRVHSSCVTGDIFGSKRCDCGPQLHQALELINQSSGLLIYLSQEGRGMGLSEKIRAYALQEQGYDTVDANLKLGFEVDSREYHDAVDVLKFFKINKLILLSNNPLKIKALKEAGFDVERQALIIPPLPENERYIKSKQERLGHLFND